MAKTENGAVPGTPGGTVIEIIPGQNVTLDAAAADLVLFTQDGSNLIITTISDGNKVVLDSFFSLAQTELPPQLTLIDGTIITAAEVIGLVEEFDLSQVIPAAGPAAGGQGGGGAGFGDYVDDGIGEGIDIADLLLRTELEFTDPEIPEELIGEEEDTPPTTTPEEPPVEPPVEPPFEPPVEPEQATYRINEIGIDVDISEDSDLSGSLAALEDEAVSTFLSLASSDPVNYIELFNYTDTDQSTGGNGETTVGDGVTTLSILGPEGVALSFGIPTVDVPAGGRLVVMQAAGESGIQTIYVVYDASGAVIGAGDVPDSTTAWPVGDDTTAELGVILSWDLNGEEVALDTFLANGAAFDAATVTHFWDSVPGTTVPLDIFGDSATFNGQIATQEVAAPGIFDVYAPLSLAALVECSPIAETFFLDIAANNIFARVDNFDSDTAADWTTGQTPTLGVANDIEDPNPQDPFNDDMDPGQPTGPDAAAGEDSDSNGQNVIVVGTNSDAFTDGETGVVEGGRAQDFLFGDDTENELAGGAHNDFLDGGAGNDMLFGESGGDVLIDDQGQDMLVGGTGTDILFGRRAAGEEHEETFDSSREIKFPDDAIAEEGDEIGNEEGGTEFGTGDLLIGDETMEGGFGNDFFNQDQNYDKSEFLALLAEDTVDGIIDERQTYMRDIIVAGDGSDIIYGDNAGLEPDFTPDDIDALYSDIMFTMSFHGPYDFAEVYREFVEWNYGGADLIYGGWGDDIIFGQGGDDAILAGHGYDLVAGGSGADKIRGNDGADTLFGDSGEDTIFGDAGSDFMQGNEDNDEMHGGAGNDYMEGNSGNDVMYGDGDGDSMYGSDGDDTMHGGEGHDYMIGDNATEGPDDGNDLMYGDDGNDVILGMGGDDTLYGNADNDYMEGGEGADSMFGGAGNDNMKGGGGADTMYGDTEDDTMLGDDGDDVMYGGDGDDFMDGNENDDIMYGGAGNDDVFGSAGNDTLYGGVGSSDTLLGNSDDDLMFGDNGDGALVGDDDYMDGGSGNDTMFGEGGSDDMLGGSGNDIMQGDAGDDVMYGNGDDDTMTGNDGSDTVDGDSGNDLLRWTAADNSDGSADIYDGDTGTDTLELYFTEAEFLAHEAEIAEFSNRVENGEDGITLTITNGDGTRTITASNIEYVAVHVNNVEIPVLIDDTITTDENTDVTKVITAEALTPEQDFVPNNDAASPTTFHTPSSVTITTAVGAEIVITAANWGQAGDIYTMALMDGVDDYGILIFDASDPEAVTVTLDIPDGTNIYDPMIDGDVTSVVFDYSATVEGIEDATVTINVNGSNEGPVAADDCVITNVLGEIYIPKYGLLVNDTDFDDDVLFIDSVEAPASLPAAPDEAYVKFPVAGDTDFDYDVSDGVETATANVDIDYTSHFTLFGTDKSEIIIGRDSVEGEDNGADTIIGGGGDDTIVGDSGNDAMDGGTGNDTFHYMDGNDGHDEIYSFGDNGDDDIINLDALFDVLGVVSAEDRADLINIEGIDINNDAVVDDTKITIDGVTDFSITLRNVDDFGDHNGDLTAAELLNQKGIMVSDES